VLRTDKYNWCGEEVLLCCGCGEENKIACLAGPGEKKKAGPDVHIKGIYGSHTSNAHN